MNVQCTIQSFHAWKSLLHFVQAASTKEPHSKTGRLHSLQLEGSVYTFRSQNFICQDIKSYVCLCLRMLVQCLQKPEDGSNPSRRSYRQLWEELNREVQHSWTLSTSPDPGISSLDMYCIFSNTSLARNLWIHNITLYVYNTYSNVYILCTHKYM